MTFFDKLLAAIERRNSLLCVGLDPNPDQLPERYHSGNIIDDLLRWNRAIVESIHDLACAYKPNIAFYEALGLPGQQLLRDTLALIPNDIPVISTPNGAILAAPPPPMPAPASTIWASTPSR